MHTVDSFFYASTCNINSVILPILSNRESIKSQAQTLSIIISFSAQQSEK